MAVCIRLFETLDSFSFASAFSPPKPLTYSSRTAAFPECGSNKENFLNLCQQRYS